MTDSTTASKKNRATNGAATAVAIIGAMIATPEIAQHISPDVLDAAKAVVTIDHAFTLGQVSGIAAIVAGVTHPPKAIVKLGKGIVKSVKKLFGKK